MLEVRGSIPLGSTNPRGNPGANDGGKRGGSTSGHSFGHLVSRTSLAGSTLDDLLNAASAVGARLVVPDHDVEIVPPVHGELPGLLFDQQHVLCGCYPQGYSIFGHDPRVYERRPGEAPAGGYAACFRYSVDRNGV